MPPCREFDLQLPELPSFDSLPTEQSFTDGEGVTGGGGQVSGVDVTTTSTIEDILGHSQNPGNETIVDSGSPPNSLCTHLNFSLKAVFEELAAKDRSKFMEKLKLLHLPKM